MNVEDNEDNKSIMTVTLSEAREMDRVAEAIVNLLEDPTIRPEALAIAQYMLHTERRSIDRVLEQLAKPGARAYVEKLLACESDILGPTPRSLGIDIISFISADKIQKSLDVKHMQLTAGSKKLAPNIKQTILYSHPDIIWIRFYSDSAFFRDLCGDDDNEGDDDNTESVVKRRIRANALAELRHCVHDCKATVIRVCDRIYEYYTDKRMIDTLYKTMTHLERDYDAHLIFCSELAFFKFDKLLFLSNYVKFVWCYALNRNHFDPRTTHDIKVMTIYLTYGLLFLDCNNLTNMPQHTHNPLIAYTGERPKISMAKFKRDSVFAAEGTRAMLTLNGSSDFGTKSNFIEITSVVDIPDDCINDIV